MTSRQRKLRAKKRARQEGAALLIVLFVLLMATTTAVYSLSSTQFEVRAAGALHQSMRTKFVSEAATVGVLGLCYELTAVGCTDLKRANGNLDSTTRQMYALPDWGSLETVYSLSGADMVGPAYTLPGAPLLADDVTISGVTVGSGGGAAGSWTPSFLSVVEKWDVPQPGQTIPSFRLIVSTYGALNYDADRNLNTIDDVVGTNELRFAHTTISATRAFIDIR